MWEICSQRAYGALEAHTDSSWIRRFRPRQLEDPKRAISGPNGSVSGPGKRSKIAKIRREAMADVPGRVGGRSSPTSRGPGAAREPRTRSETPPKRHYLFTDCRVGSSLLTPSKGRLSRRWQNDFGARGPAGERPPRAPLQEPSRGSSSASSKSR